MNALATFSLPIAILFFFFFHICCIQVKGDLAFVKDTCSKCENEKLCLEALLADPFSQDADLAGLASGCTRAVRQNVTQVVESYVQLRAAEGNSTGPMASALDECVNMYVYGGSQCGEALAAVARKEPIQALKILDSVVESTFACHNKFDELQQPYTAEMSKWQQNVKDLVDVASDLVRLLEV